MRKNPFHASRRFLTVITLAGLTLSFCSTIALATATTPECSRGTTIGNGPCSGANGTAGGCSGCCDTKCINAFPPAGSNGEIGCSTCCADACGNHAAPVDPVEP